MLLLTCKKCNNQCRKEPHYTCSGKKEPDFLTDKQRKAHQRAYERGETNWSAPFEPWVVRGWRKFSAENGLQEKAERVRQNLLNGTAKLANDRAKTKAKKT